MTEEDTERTEHKIPTERAVQTKNVKKKEQSETDLHVNGVLRRLVTLKRWWGKFLAAGIGPRPCPRVVGYSKAFHPRNRSKQSNRSFLITNHMSATSFQPHRTLARTLLVRCRHYPSFVGKCVATDGEG